MASSIDELLKANDFAAALEALLSAMAETTDPDELLAYADTLSQIPTRFFEARNYLPKKMAILGGYTTQRLLPLIRLFLFQKGILATPFEGAYGAFESLILSEDASLSRFAPDVIYLCVGTEHIASTDLKEELRRWEGLWGKARKAFHCEIVQNTFEEPAYRPFGNYEMKLGDSRIRFIKELNLSLGEKAPSYVHLNDTDSQAAFYGRAHWRDEKLYDLTKIPVSLPYWGVYARNVASVIAAIFGKSKKCLVVDLDNTLWGGVVGDDGVAALEIGAGSPTGESFLRFQTYLKELRRRGVLLAVCSKNEEANATAPFRMRSEMILKESDFAAFVANWQPKTDNLIQIARNLNIGLDSMVFVDDNPAEREIIRRYLKEVEVIEFPEDPAEYTLALNGCGLFEAISLTEEDRARAEQYRANTEREKAAQGVQDYGAYLESLKMEACLTRFDEIHLPRIVQLINKTNQFNLTTPRYTEAEVSRFMRDRNAFTRYVKLHDKFGDNGLISVFIATAGPKGEFLIDTWLMSCRVLKRGVEQWLFREVCRSFIELGGRALIGRYHPTPKNGLVRSLLPELGFQHLRDQPDGASEWRWDLTDSTAVERLLSTESPIRLVPCSKEEMS